MLLKNLIVYLDNQHSQNYNHHIGYNLRQIVLRLVEEKL